ncbi:hypothetical protein SIID45300_02110 [Candidatus Magnetaquicoccaceae bacterium FCR-1]|uniref:Uncharacterized protein n=1 Tax=Candidatus Magnetaquiglobus chichijimensis TaxID=3141448 RepID=A0ABQ0CA74_9PROT
MNLNKRKPGCRSTSNERLLAERAGRPSILDNQKIEPRQRVRLHEIRQEGARIEQRAQQQAARETQKRRSALAASAGEHPFGVRLLEGGIVLAAGITLMFRNGMDHVADWIRDGRDMMVGLTRRRPRPWELEETLEEQEESVWHRDDGDEHGGSVRLIGQTGHDPSLDAISETAGVQSPLRPEVERTKVQRLDAEEEGLPDDHLEDQIGALRARLSTLSRPV